MAEQSRQVTDSLAKRLEHLKENLPDVEGFLDAMPLLHKRWSTGHLRQSPGLLECGQWLLRPNL